RKESYVLESAPSSTQDIGDAEDMSNMTGVAFTYIIVEANLRGPVGLGKWASIFVILQFSSAPPEVLFLRHDTCDSGPDMSLDIPASPGYVSGIGHASFAKVTSYVSPSEVSRETIPHHVPPV
ncbi:hypothetical protein Tco_1349982, partial [Tanacetum coccineum]